MTYIESSTKKTLAFLGNFIIVFGIIGAFIIANSYGYSISEYSSKMKRDVGLTITLFLICFISSLIFRYLLKAAAEVVESLETINNNIANLGSSQSGVHSDGSNSQPDSVCVSGQASLASGTNSGRWFCPSCGNENRSFDQFCTSCGVERPNHD